MVWIALISCETMVNKDNGTMVNNDTQVYSDFYNAEVKSVDRRHCPFAVHACTNVFSLCSHCCLYSHDGG